MLDLTIYELKECLITSELGICEGLFDKINKLKSTSDKFDLILLASHSYH